jgi:hypothetical protein
MSCFKQIAANRRNALTRSDHQQVLSGEFSSADEEPKVSESTPADETNSTDCKPVGGKTKAECTFSKRIGVPLEPHQTQIFTLKQPESADRLA